MNSEEISKELDRLASEYTDKLGPIIAHALVEKMKEKEVK